MLGDSPYQSLQPPAQPQAVAIGHEQKHHHSIELPEEIKTEAIRVVPQSGIYIETLPRTATRPPVRVIRLSQAVTQRLRNTSKALALMIALSDATSIIMSLNDMEEMSDDTLTKKLGLSIGHMYFVAPTFYAIPSFDVYYPSIVDGFKMAISFYYSDIPLRFQSPCCGMDVFYCCDRFRTFVACATILTVACFSAAADGLDGNYFALNIVSDPGLFWTIISGIFSVPVAFSTILTDSPELFYYFCSNISEALLPVLEHNEEYVPPAPEDEAVLSPHIQTIDTFLGNYLRITGGSIELAIEVYVALAALMNPTSLEAKYILFSISFLRSSTNFFFYGKKGLDAIHAFFLTMAEGPSLKQFLLFNLGIIPVALVMDCLRELYRRFLTDPATDMPIYLPNFMVEYIAVHTAIFEGVVLLGATISLLSRGCDYVQDRMCCPVRNNPVQQEEKHIAPTASSLDDEKSSHLIEMGSSSKEKIRRFDDEDSIEAPFTTHLLDDWRDEAVEDEDENEIVYHEAYRPPIRRAETEEEKTEIVAAPNRHQFFHHAPPEESIAPAPPPRAWCAIM